jgi:hypothetical protein
MKHLRALPPLLWKLLQTHAGTLLELALVILFAWIYAGGLLDFDPSILQQSGEHNESAARPILADYGLKRNGEIPLWNHFMQTGFPHAGDLLGHFWSPVATLPVWIWGGINGMKVSIFLTFLFAGLGQWHLARVTGAKGMFRVWSALMFTFSGGLALLWRVGWYELLVGAAWFPWTFAAFWQALHKRDITSLASTAFCAAMVISTGGGYYPFYLAGGALVILAGALVASPRKYRQMTLRATATALWIAGLCAVVILPIYDGYRLIVREPGPDLAQTGSQPVHYGLINYLVSDPAWFHSQMLGALGGWNWFYIGPLSLGALIFLFYALKNRRGRAAALTFFAVFVIYLLWSANRYTIFKYLYDFWPFLYSLRFPNRLYIIAASPLLAVSACSLQSLVVVLRRWLAKYRVILSTPGEAGEISVNLRIIANLVMLAILFFSARDLFQTNRGIAIAPAPLDKHASSTLKWLREYDPGLYYINLGGGFIWWAWIPAATDLEMPVINFVYSQTLASKFAQERPDAPFYAQPKYQVSRADEPPANGVRIRDFDSVVLWGVTDALPFAFSAPPTAIAAGAKLGREMALEQAVKYDGPNRIKVQGSPANEDDMLVVLVSDYPGWKVRIDDQPANLEPVNGYLGVRMLSGKHQYTFFFDPPLHRIGLTISLLTLISLALLVGRETYQKLRSNP